MKFYGMNRKQKDFPDIEKPNYLNGKPQVLVITVKLIKKLA
jgi:hypothetical protein